MRAKQARNLAALLATILVLGTGFNNCGQRRYMSFRESALLSAGSLRGGTSGGNPAVSTTIKFGPFDAGDSTPDAQRPSVSINELSLCISRFTFRPADGGRLVHVSSDQPIAMNAEGTTFGSVAIPPGAYDQVGVEVSDSCNTGFSLSLVNSSGTIQTSASSSMTFEGKFKVPGEGVTLNIVEIALALAGAANDAEALEGLKNAGTVQSDVTTLDGGGK